MFIFVILGFVAAPILTQSITGNQELTKNHQWPWFLGVLAGSCFNSVRFRVELAGCETYVVWFKNGMVGFTRSIYCRHFSFSNLIATP